MVRPTVLSMLACVVTLVFAVPAQAEEPPRLRGHAQKASPAGPLLKRGKARAAAADRLWATVNLCDTERSPDAMGIRASMPGNGRRQLMFMRFSVQWWSGSAQQWLPVPGGVSPWLRAGSARYVARQRGYTFDFVTPPSGRAYVLRGIAQFHWRGLHRPKGARKRARKANWKLTRQETVLTRTGVQGVDGGDPPGTSKAMCMVANLG